MVDDTLGREVVPPDPAGEPDAFATISITDGCVSYNFEGSCLELLGLVTFLEKKVLDAHLTESIADSRLN